MVNLLLLAMMVIRVTSKVMSKKVVMIMTFVRLLCYYYCQTLPYYFQFLYFIEYKI